MNQSLKKLLLIGTSILLLAACSPGGSNSTEKSEGSTSQETEEQTNQSTTSENDVQAISLLDTDVNDQETFEEEPMYGQSIPIISVSGCTAPVNVAYERGYYEEAGLDVEMVQSTSTIVDGVGTGQAAMGTGHITTSLVPMSNDVNAQYVGGLHTGCKSLYVLEDSEYESTEDLVGSTIGIGEGVGSSDHNIALRFFYQDGLNIDDFEFKNTDDSIKVQAMENEELQGAMFLDSFAQEFVDQGIIRPIRSLSYDEDYADETCCALFMNKDFIAENPIHAKRMVDAVERVREWADEDTPAYVDYLYEKDLMSGEEDNGLKFIDSLNYQVSAERTEQSIRDIIDDYIDMGILDADTNPDDLMAKVWGPALSGE